MQTESSTNTLNIHGVFLEINGMGVLLVGPSGIGKSELALVLINKGHRLIADDSVCLWLENQMVYGASEPLLENLLEVRGLGVLDIKSMFGESATKKCHPLHLIIDLRTFDHDELARIDRLQGLYAYRTFLDQNIPQVTIPVTTGGNLAVLVEAAVRKQQLSSKGFDASAAFCEKQRTTMKHIHLTTRDVYLCQ
jgi:HPr kinase/phosphorylase